MIATSDFKKGIKILFKDTPYIIIDYQHVKPGKGGAFVRTKMKNMLTGFVSEQTFRSGEKFPQPDLRYCNMQYLYVSDQLYHFMDQETFDQVALDEKVIAAVKGFLKEQIIYTVVYFDEKPIQVIPPLFVELLVKETVPGVKGDTAQGAGYKAATLETGLVVQVPLFVVQGDLLKIDTRDSKYIERVRSEK